MVSFRDKIDIARQAGITDKEIFNRLKKSIPAKIEKAQEAGISDEDIINRLIQSGIPTKLIPNKIRPKETFLRPPTPFDVSTLTDKFQVGFENLAARLGLTIAGGPEQLRKQYER